MPTAEHVTIPVGDLALQDAAGRAVTLSRLGAVHVLVLMRHRH